MWRNSIWFNINILVIIHNKSELKIIKSKRINQINICSGIIPLGSEGIGPRESVLWLDATQILTWGSKKTPHLLSYWSRSLFDNQQRCINSIKINARFSKRALWGVWRLFNTARKIVIFLSFLDIGRKLYLVEN